jgi:hypothetical protein
MEVYLRRDTGYAIHHDRTFMAAAAILWKAAWNPVVNSSCAATIDNRQTLMLPGADRYSTTIEGQGRAVG